MEVRRSRERPVSLPRPGACWLCLRSDPGRILLHSRERLDELIRAGGLFAHQCTYHGLHCGLTTAHDAYCWGEDTFGGELGNGLPEQDEALPVLAGPEGSAAAPARTGSAPYAGRM